MTRPEDRARAEIDRRLTQAGWLLQDMAQLDPSAGRGVAVREYPTDRGPADYLLLVDRQPVGVIEAKRDEEGQRITAHETQTERYANATLKWQRQGQPLRFLFEATGQITRFTDGLDPAPRSREIFHFYRPEQLATWLAQASTLRGRLAHGLPALHKPCGSARSARSTGLSNHWRATTPARWYTWPPARARPSPPSPPSTGC